MDIRKKLVHHPIEGEIFVSRYSSGEFINMSGGANNARYYINVKMKNFNNNGYFSEEILEATEEEKQHLLACIIANKYIPFEELNLQSEYFVY